MNKDDKIYVAGHRGMVGSAIIRKLESQGYNNLTFRSHDLLLLTRQKMVENFFDMRRPDYVILAAAKVGGIHANSTYPAEFIYDNLMIQSNIIHSAYKHGVKGLLFLGSSCIYPKLCEQPIQEKELLSGYLEPSNEPYAIAKIAGIKMCESYNRQYGTDFRSIMPTNLYGPNDNFHSTNSHVIPALMRRFHEAKENGDSHVTIWGSGRVKREFLHVDDLADASLHVMQCDKEEIRSHINVGSGEDLTIHELALLIQLIVGYEGGIVFDDSQPDGTPRKVLDVSYINNTGWNRSIDLEVGLADTYQWFLEHQSELRV